MIKIERRDLDGALSGRLDSLTRQLHAAIPAQRDAAAKRLWKGQRPVRRALVDVLAQMAPGMERCMYCGDSQGSAIDHFEPVARDPLRTFDWLNHLLACTHCNSHHKREQFPVGADGVALLIDPTIEDPFDHLRLSLAAGRYAARTPKGRETIEVFQLNRQVLVEGRITARASLGLWLGQWSRLEPDNRHVLLQVVRAQPHADVCQAMLRAATEPGAAELFSREPGLLDALLDRALRAELLR